MIINDFLDLVVLRPWCLCRTSAVYPLRLKVVVSNMKNGSILEMLKVQKLLSAVKSDVQSVTDSDQSGEIATSLNTF